jgi:hypothetical protein
MRWFRRARTDERAGADPGRQEALIHQIRAEFGASAQAPNHEQVAALTALLVDAGDDGLSVAVRIVRDVAEEAHADVIVRVAAVNTRLGGGYALAGRDYRPLWRQVGRQLGSPLFALPCGFHPYVQVPAALAVIAAHARRCVRLSDPLPLLAALFEVLDLTTAGWEFGGVRLDTDTAGLAGHLITAAQRLRGELPDEPPSLPSAIRELMRRNDTVDVYDPAGRTVVGGINVGAQMRPAFLT